MFRIHETLRHYITFQHSLSGQFLGVDSSGQFIHPSYLTPPKDECKFEVHLMVSRTVFYIFTIDNRFYGIFRSWEKRGGMDDFCNSLNCFLSISIRKDMGDTYQTEFSTSLAQSPYSCHFRRWNTCFGYTHEVPECVHFLRCSSEVNQLMNL